MAAKFFAMGVLLALAVVVLSEEPECPQLRCRGGQKVACFIGEDRCQCRCVSDEDPCTSLINHACPEAHTLSCTSKDITCKCKCVLK
uniref:Putative secreted protein n=1 Tax=Amblyomma cajennense TaxID=34607 RepID=A0A023FDL6_AMBCJ